MVALSTERPGRSASCGLFVGHYSRPITPIAQKSHIWYSAGLMVIRMRHTRAHTRNRRSHHALKAANLSACSHCGAAHRPHHMCLACGYYNGRQVMDLAAEKSKREARMRAKQEVIKNSLGQQSESTGEAERKEKAK